jgi:hypothetical protein
MIEIEPSVWFVERRFVWRDSGRGGGGAAASVVSTSPPAAEMADPHFCPPSTLLRGGVYKVALFDTQAAAGGRWLYLSPRESSAAATVIRLVRARNPCLFA